MIIEQKISETLTTATVIDNHKLYRGLWIACQRVRGSAAVAFLHWLLSRIDSDAIFVYNKELLDVFAQDMEKELGYSYKPFTIEDAVRELQRAKVVVRVSRGTYQIQSWVWMGESIPTVEIVTNQTPVKLNDKGLVINGKTPGMMLPRKDELEGVTKEMWDKVSADLQKAGMDFTERDVPGLGKVRVPKDMADIHIENLADGTAPRIKVELPKPQFTAPPPSPPLPDEQPVEEVEKAPKKPGIFSGLSWD